MDDGLACGDGSGANRGGAFAATAAMIMVKMLLLSEVMASL